MPRRGCSDARNSCVAERSCDMRRGHGRAGTVGTFARRVHGAGWCVGQYWRMASCSLSAVVLSADGVRRLTASEVGSPSEAESLGIRVADVLLAQGAAELIAASRNG